MKRGYHWRGEMQFTGLPDDIEGRDVWARIKPALVKGGWTIVKEFDQNPFTATFRYQKGGKDTWGHVMIPSAMEVGFDIVETGPQPLKFSVPAPAAQPEKVSAERGDFPYLPPLPGSTDPNYSFDPGPFLVNVPEQPEPEQVAMGKLVKGYHKAGLSNVQFLAVYGDAMKAAGWTIHEQANGGDAFLVAHYAKNPRELWAYLHEDNGDYSLQVADVSKDDLAARLAKECRVPLYGVLFDFDKATLKSDSDAILTRARDALKANAKLAIEVQGHTDNVGSDDYNLRLSQARAKAVMDWLVKNGIPAARLTSKGYGRGKPVATNDTPEGRAQNRRVELSCRK
jgi:outer membrane protein OmpA-like peptidoglycan-associated protein